MPKKEQKIKKQDQKKIDSFPNNSEFFNEGEKEVFFNNDNGDNNDGKENISYIEDEENNNENEEGYDADIEDNDNIEIDDNEENEQKTRGRSKHLNKDPIVMFLEEISMGGKLLSRKEEIELSKEAKAGSLWAKNRLVSLNLRLTIANAKKVSGGKLTFLDIVQEGSLGLIKSVEKFEHELGFRLSTYSMWWIKQSANRGKNLNSKDIRIPVHIYEDLILWQKVENELFQILKRQPTTEEIVERLKTHYNKIFSPQKIRLLQIAQSETISLEKTVGDDKKTTLENFLPSEENVSPMEYAASSILKDKIFVALEKLSPKEKGIIILRYGLVDGFPRTLELIGVEFGITRERVRQIEVKAIRRIRLFHILSFLRNN